MDRIVRNCRAADMLVRGLEYIGATSKATSSELLGPYAPVRPKLVPTQRMLPLRKTKNKRPELGTQRTKAR